MAAPPPPINFGEHLYADIIHDFPKFVGKFYNIPFAYSGKAGDYTENATSERLLAAVASQGGAIGTAFAARLNQKIVFTVPKKTATFQKTEPPSLFGGGNQFVGIVQDAGEYITDFLGAQNVLTFGSILDPASKPIGDDKRPIWFDVGPGTNVTIPLAEFGFNPEYIENITVGGLRGGGLVSALFRIKGKSYDAVKMTEYDGSKVPGAKPINNTKIEVSGYFTSIEGANLAQISRRSTGRTPPAEEQLYFNIGKTLGDVMLVASIMPRFQQQMSATGPVDNPNPFYLSASGTWKKFSSEEPHAGPIPQILVLKTGDILNHTRAVLKGAPSILERQAGAGRIVKQYEFVPADADPAAVRAAFLSRYANLVADVTSTYDRLISSFGNCLVGGMLKPGYSNFSGTGDVVKTPNGKVRAAELIDNIQKSLIVLRDRVVFHYKVRLTTANAITGDPNNSKLRDLYETDLSSFRYFVPQTLDVFDERKQLMKTKIVVAQVPRTGLEKVGAAPLPVGTLIEICMWNAFTKLDGMAVLDSSIIGTTDLGKRFFNRIPPQLDPTVYASAPTAEQVLAVAAATAAGTLPAADAAAAAEQVIKVATEAFAAAPAPVKEPELTGETGQEITGTVEEIVKNMKNPIPDANYKKLENIVGDLGESILEDPGAPRPDSPPPPDTAAEIDEARENLVGGGVRRKLILNTEFAKELHDFWKLETYYESIPETMYLFMKYLRGYDYFTKKSELIAFNCVLEVCEIGMSSPNYSTILDVDLLFSLKDDIAAIRSKIKIIEAPKSWGDNSISTLASVLLFNAFTCYVNSENAKNFQSPDDAVLTDDNEISIYYKEMENQLRQQAAPFFRGMVAGKLSVTGSKKTRKLKVKRRAGKTERR